MSWSKTLSIITPAGGDDPKDGDDRIRELKSAFIERIAQDHFFPIDTNQVSDVSAGEHKKVTLRVLTPAPTAVADKGLLYAFDAREKAEDDYKAELHYKNESGVVTQLTNSAGRGLFTGNLAKLTDALLAGIRLLWSGSIASIPAGWEIDTTLYNKFIVGAGGTYAVDATGGATTHTLTVAEMPAHTHTYYRSNAYSLQSGDSSSSAKPYTGPFNTGSEGGGSAHNNLPPYIAKAYIKIT